jgi:hypothetical protein
MACFGRGASCSSVADSVERSAVVAGLAELAWLAVVAGVAVISVRLWRVASCCGGIC